MNLHIPDCANFTYTKSKLKVLLVLNLQNQKNFFTFALVMLTQNQKELIEKIGIYFEQGMQPAAARILALLIVADQDSFSFDEIRESRTS